MPRVIQFVLVFFAASVLALASPQSSPVALTPGQQELQKLLPDVPPAQAVPQGAPAFYSPETLYQYMDGGADVFLQYDVRTLLHQDYKAKEVDVTVDIFDMGSAENAFGIYAAERSPAYNFVAIGAEGYQNEGIVNFLQDRYYVKLAGFGPGIDPVLDAMARSLSQGIGASPGLPALLKQLPLEHRKAHSEQYMPKDPMGHGFLSPAYVATYAFQDQESKLLVSVGQSEDDAQQRLGLLEKHFRSTGQCADAPVYGAKAIACSNSFEGRVAAVVKGRYLLLLVNPVDGGQQLLKEATEQLK